MIPHLVTNLHGCVVGTCSEPLQKKERISTDGPNLHQSKKMNTKHTKSTWSFQNPVNIALSTSMQRRRKRETKMRSNPPMRNSCWSAGGFRNLHLHMRPSHFPQDCSTWNCCLETSASLCLSCHAYHHHLIVMPMNPETLTWTFLSLQQGYFPADPSEIEAYHSWLEGDQL